MSLMEMAVLAAALSALVGGLMGPFVVVNRLGFLAGAIAHGLFGGIGLAYYFQFDLTLGAVLAALFFSILFGTLSYDGGAKKDTLIGAIWTVGMAVGVLFMTHANKTSGDLFNFLFGNILLVGNQELVWMAVLSVGLLAAVGFLFRPLYLVSFDREFSEVKGLPSRSLYVGMVVMISLAVVVLIQVVGLIMSMALLTLPASIALNLSRSLRGALFVSCGLTFFFNLSGLALSVQLDWPTGPTIVLLMGLGYFVLRRR